MIREIYFWTEEKGTEIFEFYDNIDRDSNWFNTKEKAFDWLIEQKKLNPEFGEDILFKLNTLYHIV